MGNDTTGQDKFYAGADRYNELDQQLTELMDSARRLGEKIGRTTDPAFKRYYARQLERRDREIDVVKAQMEAIVAEVAELQRSDASVPHAVDDLDLRLPKRRAELHAVNERLKHLRGLPPAQLSGGERQRLMRQLEDEAGAHGREIRRLESTLIAALDDEEARA